MNTFVRWCKFNLVGAIGAGFQLGVLALLIRMAPGHWLLATGGAIEVTLLHNFMWDLHVTWRDRRERRALGWQLVRFHLSNGVVSVVGNVTVMRVLVNEAHIPVLPA